MKEGTVVGVIVTNDRHLLRDGDVMLMQRTDHAQRHLVIPHQHGGKLRRLPQNLQRAVVPAFCTPVTVDHRHRTDVFLCQRFLPAFQTQTG
ncbi:hypothetical protein D3C80_1900650 [compost metagenome]